MAPAETIQALVQAVAVSLCLFAIFFGTVLWPNIERTTFTRGTCEVVASTIVPRYGCWVTGCDYCGVTGEPYCTTLMGRYQGRDPARCANEPDQCAPSRAVCTLGPKCCHQTCDTCKDCTTVDGKKSCTTRSCNCRCTLATPANRCDMACGILYKDVITVSHEGGSGTLVRDFAENRNAAENWLAEWPIGKTFECFFKDTRIELTNDFDTWRIIVFTLFGAAPIYFSVFCLIIAATDNPLLSSMFWNGLVLPLVILLPIQRHGAMTKQAAESLWIAVWVLFCIFFLLPIAAITVTKLRCDCDFTKRKPKPVSTFTSQEQVERAQPINLVVAEVVDPRAGASASQPPSQETTKDALAYL